MKRVHNKKQNAALLIEFLVRHISKCLINDNKEDAQKALNISKKYFSKGTALHEELNLFKSLMDTKVKNRDCAQKIVSEIISESRKSDLTKLSVEKAKLVKEINHTFGNEEIYNYKIPNYTSLASIQTLMTDARNGKQTLSTVERIKLEESIIENLVSEHTSEVVDNFKVDPNYNSAICKFVVQRFHKKYADKLTETQKKFLTKYAVFLISENKGVMQSAIDKEVREIKNKLQNIQDESIYTDADLMKKLKECYKKLSVTNFDEITEEKVLEVMQYMQLVDEIDS